MSTQEPPTKRSKTGGRRRRHRSRSKTTRSGDNDTNTSIDASNNNNDCNNNNDTSNTVEEAIPITRTKKLPLAGITVAVSSLVNVVKNSQQQKQQNQQHHDNDNDNDSDSDKDEITNHDDCDDMNRQPSTTATTTTTSYKTIRKLALELGATVSSQVHKRVAALVCTTNSFVQQQQEPQRDETESNATTISGMATQRVRKAIKFNIPLIHVQWLYDCQTQCKYLPWKDYELDKSLVTIKPPRNGDTDASIKPINQTNMNSKNDNNNNDNDDTNCSVNSDEIPDTGWTPAQDLGCCCVCHETNEGTVSQSLSCPWCTDCSVNRIKHQSIKKPTD